MDHRGVFSSCSPPPPPPPSTRRASVNEAASAGIDHPLYRRVGALRRRRRGGVRLFGRRLARPLSGRRDDARHALPECRNPRRPAGVSHRSEDTPLALTGVTGVLPSRHRRRRRPGPGGAPGRPERPLPRPRRLPVRAGQRGVGVRAGRRLVDRVQRGLGSRAAAADAGGRQLCRPHRARRAVRHLPRQRPLPAPRRGSAMVRPGRSGPATAPSRSCSATGTATASRTCASPTTASTTAAGPSSCGASRRTWRRAPMAAPRAGGSSRSGAWASPRPTSPATAIRTTS